MHLCSLFGFRRRSPRPHRTMMCRGAVALLLASASLFVFPGRSAEAQTSVYEKILAEKNIGVDSPALAKYLKDLHPTPEQREKAKMLIRQLGDSSFRVRERATVELQMMVRPPTEALVVASKGDDPEIRRRAQQVLDVGKPAAVRVMHAAFHVIAAKKTPGLMAELLAAIPLCDKRYLESAARRAIDAAAKPEDAEILRKALRGENAQVRVAAASGLGKAVGQDARGDLHALLKDREDRVKLAAAEAIADLGDRKCLATLLAMLNSDELLVRVSAATALRQLSGKHHGFAAYHTAEERAKIVAQWKAWVDGDGKTAKLIFPLKRFGAGRGYLGGNTLLAFGHKKKVVEYDPAGKEVWSYTSTSSVWSAEKMANGNVLIAELSGHRVIQVSPQGKVVWQYKVTSPINAKPLTNGNVLIAQHTGASQAIEVNPAGKVVWKHTVGKTCSDVHRLENGNTLISSYGASVVEVTPEGKVVWEYAERQCYGCQPLRNGNVLITNLSSGKVIEVTREKKIVWECKHAGAADAFRLPNGNTLITGQNQFVEMTPDKKIVWSKSGCQYGTARR